MLTLGIKQQRGVRWNNKINLLEEKKSKFTWLFGFWNPLILRKILEGGW